MSTTIHKKFILLFGILATFSVGTEVSHASESQVLSVTPPLFQLSVLPGDIWQSNIKVVNSNAYPLTVSAEVVNFAATGENGQGKFIPLLTHDNDTATLAEWIDVAKDPYIIPPERSLDIPFIIEVPKDASPGGHYAAVLITTQPSSNTNEKLVVQTSQSVTSLFFVRVEGDVKEIGSIREFTVLRALLPRPEAEFSLRFENKGNVHLQPRGNIVIANMWGTERGVIPINNQTHFGNVLPESIRDFKFSWQSEFNITDIGRYKAIVTLVYGDDGIKNVSAIAYFWVLPIKLTLITLLVLGTFIFIIVWMIKRYVRRMLLLAGVEVRTESKLQPDSNGTHEAEREVKTRSTYKKVSAPLRDGVLDLRQRLSTVDESRDKFETITKFILSYKVFFISVCILAGIFAVGYLYIGKATEEHNNYKVIINEGDSTTTLQGSEIKQGDTQ